MRRERRHDQPIYSSAPFANDARGPCRVADCSPSWWRAMLEGYVPPPLVIATQEGRDSSRPFLFAESKTASMAWTLMS